MNTNTTSRETYDAVVVGARVAGASTAMLLARMGLRVLVVDRGRLGSDTLSTHALMRGGVLQLHRWGVLEGIQAAGTPPIRSTSFHYGDETLTIPIKAKDGIAALVSPKRTVLDAHLAEAARAAGAELAFGVQLLDLVRDGRGRVTGVTVAGADDVPVSIAAPIVIGADGTHSKVARLAGAPVEHRRGHAAAVLYGYWSGLDVEGYHWHYAPGVSVGAIPTNDGHVCVFASARASRFDEMLAGGMDTAYRAILAEGAPELHRSLAGKVPAGRLHPFPGIPGFLRRAWGPGWALVGDAGYFKDPITAHGITDALRDAESLARAVAAGTESAMEDYRQERDAGALGILDVTDRIASYAWNLDQVKELHLELSRLMALEVEGLRELPPVPAASAVAA